MYNSKIDYMRVYMITYNHNKIRRMNNGGRWIYKEEKMEPSKP